MESHEHQKRISLAKGASHGAEREHSRQDSRSLVRRDGLKMLGPGLLTGPQSHQHVSIVLALANIALLAFHTGLIVFNVLGWIWTATRKWNLATQLATLGSWVGMGAVKGWGYCVCTDVHWSIRRQMGIVDDPPTYVGFLIRQTTGARPSDDFVFWLTVVVFTLSFGASIGLNLRDWTRRKRAAVRL